MSGRRNIRVALATLALAAGLTSGGVSAAVADTTPAGQGSSAAGCTWKPKLPYEHASANTGYIRANLVVKGCSSNSHWNGQLEAKIGPFWDTVDELEWRGNGGQRLQEDCPDGERDTYRARMQNLRTGQVKYRK